MAGKLFYRHYILHYIYYAKYKYREKYMSHLLRLCVKEESRLQKPPFDASPKKMAGNKIPCLSRMLPDSYSEDFFYS